MSIIHFYSLRKNTVDVLFSIDKDKTLTSDDSFDTQDLVMENMYVKDPDDATMFLCNLVQNHSCEDLLDTWNEGNDFVTIAATMNDVLVFPDLCMNLTSFTTPSSEVRQLYEKVRLSIEFFVKKPIKPLAFDTNWMVEQDNAAKEWKNTMKLYETR